MSHAKRFSPRVLHATFAGLLFTLLSSSAYAEDQRKLWNSSFELFGAKNVDSSNDSRFGFGVGGAAYAEVLAADWLGVQAGLNFTWFAPGDPVRDTNDDGVADTTSSTYWLGLSAGARLHWSELLMDSRDDGWVDFHFVWGSNKGFKRPGFDLGAGYEFALQDDGNLRLGPFVRFTWLSSAVDAARDLADGSVNVGVNPMWLSFGASLGWGGGLRPEYTTDTDGDGVMDAYDLCPEEAAGANPDPDRRGCPRIVSETPAPPPAAICPEAGIGDQDNDGIIDRRDQCPTAPEDFDTYLDGDGCPDPDNDNDGFLDADDQCPLEAEVVNGENDYDGCPDEGLFELKGERIVLDERVFFKFARARVHRRAKPTLRAIVKLFRLQKDWRRVRIEGHSDAQGNAGFNQRLSERRARNVLKELVRLGMPEHLLESIGYGPLKPVDTGDTPEAHRRNRRVEFVIISRGDDDIIDPDS